MIRKSLAFLLISFVVVVVGEGQTAAPGGKADSKSFSFFFAGDGGYLGVQTEEVTKDNFAKYGLREVRGVAIEKVMEGSPAEKAGLQAADVIVKFNNEEVTSVRKLTRLLGEVSPDHQIKMTIIRAGSDREVTATMGKRPMPKFDEGAFSHVPGAPFPPSGEFPRIEGFPRGESFPRMEALPPGAPDQPFMWRTGSGRRIGVGVTALTKQLSEFFGVESGLMINEVRADSPAAKAGLKAGDIIVEVEGKPVKGDFDLIRAIAEKKEGDVILTVVRDRNRQTIRVTPEEVKDGFDNMRFEFPRTSGGAFAPGSMRFTMPTVGFPTGGFRFPSSIWCIL